MVKIRRKTGRADARIDKDEEIWLENWTRDNSKSKSEVIEYLLKKFHREDSLQQEFLNLAGGKG